MAAGVFHRGDDVRIVIELLAPGLLEQQVLIDQPFEHRNLGGGISAVAARRPVLD